MRRPRDIILIGGIVLWFTVLILLFSKQSSLEFTGDERKTVERALNEMNELRRDNQELRHVISSINKLQFKNATDKSDEMGKLQHRLAACITSKECKSKAQGVVTKEHEVLVRRNKNNVVELKYAFDRALEDIKKNPNALNDKLDQFKASFTTQMHAAVLDVEDLHSLNDDWREKEAKDLRDLIRSRINYLQNPKDCDNARKLVCNLNKGCGFGCQLHHLAYCFMVAYGTERTLIIESTSWRYNQQGWEAVFLPASDTCMKSSKAEQWRGEAESKNTLSVSLSIVDGLTNRPPYLPLGFPNDIGQRLLRLHGNPSVWWVGQFVDYLLRPQPWLRDAVDEMATKSDFKTPCVGVHVRRTDKVGTEAAFHGIEEYMKHVIAWYDKLDMKLDKEKSAKSVRRVYLASDDSSVLPEARKKYPDYVFYGDTKIAKSASLGSRYSKDSLRGVMIDIYMLSKCNFLSCTFSSQVCRVAYELMQNLHPDASDFFHSLDDIYYYGGQTGHDQKAVLPHQAGPGEIELEVGDTVGIAGNHWDGFSKGTNKRTRSVGLYPSYKVEEIFRLVKYPTYEKAASRT